MPEEKNMRLSQVSRKLNVATPVIIAYLAEKGFNLPNNPNTKITSEQYDMIAKEFAEAMLEKEEAAELVIGQSYERDTKSILQKAIIAAPPTLSSPLGIFPPLGVISPSITPITPASISTPQIEQATEASPDPSEDQVLPPSPHDKPVIPEGIMEQEVSRKKDLSASPPSSKISFVDPEGLKGVTVLGKIVLEDKELKGTKKFQQVTSSDLEKKSHKRPRKRIIFPATGTESSPKTEAKGTNYPAKNSLKNKTKVKSSVKPPEVQKNSISEKEIQEQIKSTLAKLTTNKAVTNRAKYRREKRSLIAEEQVQERLQADQNAKKLVVTEFISANDLATLMGVSINDLLSTCMNLGLLISINQRLDAEVITILADEFGYQVEFTDVKAQEVEVEEAADPADLVERAPIVTIMGHVDHGKTSLLDYIRRTQITKTEAGGITQHIGAYDVGVKNGKRISFLDTPGHEAFTAMRARGVRLTDIAVIVIAADDGVKPQTKEAINHAKLAGLPLVIAINKIDRHEAKPEKVKEELAQLNILVEDWGGKYQVQGVSAITGQGIEELLEKILFEAELLELKANPKKKAKGTVIEASLDQGRGYLATVMVQEGTLQVGQVMLAGAYFGKIKAMFDYQGRPLKKALPSTPVQILGINGAPQAGDRFDIMDSEKKARGVATHRQQLLREQGLRTKTHITLDEIGRRLAIGNFKELNLIIKGDVDGSVEALADSLLKLSTEEIKLKILHKGVGTVIESDVLLAAASDAIIIGFQVRPSIAVRKLAEEEGVEIRLYTIIYDVINNIRDAMQGMLAPTIEEIVTGTAIVKETFKITGIGLIAGCHVTEGYIKRGNDVRVSRDGIVIYTGAIKHLKHFKEDVQQAKAGSECGININHFNDIKIGDEIEGFEKKSVERKL